MQYIIIPIALQFRCSKDRHTVGDSEAASQIKDCSKVLKAAIHEDPVEALVAITNSLDAYLKKNNMHSVRVTDFELKYHQHEVVGGRCWIAGGAIKRIDLHPGSGKMEVSE